MMIPTLMGLGYLGAAGFNPMTPCNVIPNGDPYRVPGNQCAGVNGSLSFDSSGNLVSAGSAGGLPTAQDQMPMFSNNTMFLLGAGAATALGAVIWAFRGKR